MTTVTVTEDIGGKAAAVWAILSDFGGIKVGGPITAVALEGAGVGMTRSIEMGGGKIIERLNVHDDASMVFSYAILNDDCPLPVKGYSAEVRVTDKGDGTCNVRWTGTFEPKGAPEADAVKVIEGIYKGGIAGARKAVGG